MREIKFRAWDKTSNQMIPFDEPGLIEEYSCICWCSSKYPGIGELPNSYGKLDNNIDNYILMQYTGLKDKNGREIYEGDIVEMGDNYPCEIIWDKERAMFIMLEVDGGIHEMDAYTTGVPPVIGNIYENPELIKENK